MQPAQWNSTSREYMNCFNHHDEVGISPACGQLVPIQVSQKLSDRGSATFVVPCETRGTSCIMSTSAPEDVLL